MPDIDIMFTGQRNDGGGLYYYGARYYDVGIGRFLSADTVVQSYANPQTLNRYSYCVNNPLKYTDPSGHLVIFDDPAFQAFLQQWDITSGGSMYTGDPSTLLEDWLKLRTSWDQYRGIDPTTANELEQSSIVFTLRFDDVSGSRVAEFDRGSKTITLVTGLNMSSHGSMLAFAHEVRHGQQEILFDNAAGSWDKKKWDDTTYREWDAYKYAGDLDDRLGWHQYWYWPWDAQCYAQKLDLDVDYSQYSKWRQRLFSGNGSETLRELRGIYESRGWFLTADDYGRR